VYNYLLNNEVDVKYDGSYFKLHDKVVIIDENTTITGSFNFTNSATKNNENSLIINSKDIAKKYLEHFNKIYSKGVN
jgi:phosphatidylserine/phosphatidylglycerophosphate/cardiolipin synthase-like enzyme